MAKSTLFKDGNNYGELILLISLLLLTPLIVLPFYPEETEYAYAFLIPAFFSAALGLMIFFGFRDKGGQPARPEFMSHMRSGSTPVLFVWCYAFLLGSLPFFIGRQLPFHLSLFESISGWTTTGLSVADIDALPHIFLFYRSFTQYCGGLGFIIMITMIIRNRRVASLYNAEGHMDMITPSLKGTAKIIARIYIIWLCLGTAAYTLCGMPVFDAVCHTMSAISTAGFSTQTLSIEAYNSIAIDIVTMVLMFIGATNFVIILSLMKGHFIESFRDTEFAFMVKVTVCFGLLTSCVLFISRGYSAGSALVHGFFGVITTFTTSGYSIEDYTLWPSVNVAALMFLMIIGGCAGSTAGGIKMNRTYYLLITMIRYLKDQIQSPIRVTTSSYQRNHISKEMDSKLTLNAGGFLVCYLLVYTAGTLILCASTGRSPGDCAFEFGSALGTVGLSNGITSPDASMITLGTEMAAMIMGRLEIVMVLISMYNIYRDINSEFHKIKSKVLSNKKHN